jgi:hypothetical protein
LRRAERLILAIGNVMADAECHVLSSWVDSTGITVQPVSRIIPPTLHAHNRGAAGINGESTRSADITLELTGRGDNTETIQVLDESHANPAPVE